MVVAVAARQSKVVIVVVDPRPPQLLTTIRDIHEFNQHLTS